MWQGVWSFIVDFECKNWSNGFESPLVEPLACTTLRRTRRLQIIGQGKSKRSQTNLRLLEGHILVITWSDVPSHGSRNSRIWSIMMPDIYTCTYMILCRLGLPLSEWFQLTSPGGLFGRAFLPSRSSCTCGIKHTCMHPHSIVGRVPTPNGDPPIH